jgi:hypothetical protein
MKHIRPLKIDGKAVYIATKQRERPYRRSQSTLDVEAIGRVSSPADSRKYICLGCCEDIYGACAGDDFGSSVYRELVDDAANVEEMAVQEFRRMCLKQQIETGNQRIAKGDSSDVAKRMDRLIAILTELETAGQ